MKEENSIFALDSELNNLWIICLSKAAHKETVWDFIIKGRENICKITTRAICLRQTLACKNIKISSKYGVEAIKNVRKNNFISIKVTRNILL